MLKMVYDRNCLKGTSKNRMIFLLKSYLTMRKSVVKRVCMGQQALSDEGTAIFRGALKGTTKKGKIRNQEKSSYRDR